MQIDLAAVGCRDDASTIEDAALGIERGYVVERLGEVAQQRGVAGDCGLDVKGAVMVVLGAGVEA